MQLDVISLISPPAGFPGLSGDHPNFTYVDHLTGTLVYMKGVQKLAGGGIGGAPWDWLTFDDKFIYQLLTENTKYWGDPSAGKITVPRKGARRLPRFIDYSASQPAGRWGFDLQQPETDYFIFLPGGIPDGSRYSNALCHCEIQGPFPALTVGDIQPGNDWQLVFQRNGKSASGVISYGSTEVITAREGYGRWTWREWDTPLAAGVIPSTKPDATSLTTHLLTPADYAKLGISAPPMPVQRLF